MAMSNFRDLSTMSSDVSAGFQFEFYCEVTSETWRSPFRPYRKGQLAGWIARLTFLFSGMHTAGRAAGLMSDAGARNAKAEALAEAQALAAQHFQQCPGCKKWVCAAAWDERGQQCIQCSAAARQQRYPGSYSEPGADESAAVCPNCQTPSQGGRFCHECGFDMASAFKSCPSCGTTLPRQARFCTDCGHGF
jgi:ribosomal protein L32